jgi:AcrR family transcriptional regulator
MAAADTRERLIEAASEILGRDGLAGLSMRKVAEAVGVSAPAIYRHFEDKEHLMMAVCEQGFRIFAKYLFTALEGKDAGERLHLAGEGYRRFALEHPNDYRAIFMTSGEQLGFHDMPKDNFERFHATFHFLEDRVRECMDEGVLHEADVRETAASIWVHVHGLASLRLVGQLDELDDEAFEAFWHRSIDALLRGLGASA